MTKAMIIVTLALAWLFANTIYAFHYAHLVYNNPDGGCVGLDFPQPTIRSIGTSSISHSPAGWLSQRRTSS